MKSKYLTLEEWYKPIRYHDDYISMINVLTNDEYQLDSEQLELITQLDGSKTFENILSGYEKDIHEHVIEYLQELVDLSIVSVSDSPRQRQFPQEWIEPYLEGLILDVTSKCNMACAHCYVSNFTAQKKGRDLSLDEWKKVFDEMVTMNVRDVTITGGEPLLRHDIRDIIDELVKRNIFVGAFFSNGLDINEDFVKYISELSHPTKLYISLDGLTPETNAKIRGTSHPPQKLFDKAVNAAKLFGKYGVKVAINTCLHPHNLDEIPGMYQLLKDIGVDQWRMAVPKPIGKYEETQDHLKPDWPAVLDTYRKIIDLHLHDVVKTDDGYTWPLLLELEMLFRSDMLSKTVKFYKPDEVACFYHRHRCAIKSNGDVISCGYYEHNVAGNVITDSLKEVWLSDKMQRVKMMKISDVKDCKDCEVLNFCGTGCRAIAQILRGDDLAKDDYCCSVIPDFHGKILPELFKKHGISFKYSEKDSYFI